MKKKILILLVLILIAFGGWYIYENRKVVKDEITLYGNIEIRQVDLSFQVAGRIKDMLKEEGDSVKKGELVAVMDERDYKAPI